jgi:hypothetical protein
MRGVIAVARRLMSRHAHGRYHRCMALGQSMVMLQRVYAGPNLTIPSVENLTVRRGDGPQCIATQVRQRMNMRSRHRPRLNDARRVIE